MSPEPRHGTGVTFEFWMSGESLPGRKRVRPVRVLISSVSSALANRSFSGFAPPRASRIGRAKIAKVTMVEIGFPGRPKQYKCDRRLLVRSGFSVENGMRANTVGLP